MYRPTMSLCKLKFKPFLRPDLQGGFRLQSYLAAVASPGFSSRGTKLRVTQKYYVILYSTVTAELMFQKTHFIGLL